MDEIARWSQARQTLADMPEAMSRPEYEAACAEMGVDAMPDTNCTIYAVRYGSFWPPEYPASHCIAMALAARRLAGIEAERAAQPRPVASVEVEMVRCDCGHTVARDLVMHASRGTSCPDCYDRMSD